MTERKSVYKDSIINGFENKVSIYKQQIVLFENKEQLYIKYNALPSIIKDSHLDIYTFNKCYPNADIFREDLKKFDPRRIYRSELSDKLSI
jgi:decaprenylphospho-beta-D-ribofuranose 2-oxidase